MASPNPAPAAGERIGRYKLLEKIGEGGCGVVYMAEQEEPVRRRVALKIIKLGMDTKEVVTRFEVERQALALMDHPNIARIFDGGATDAGRPYFVMELVRGIRITDYCDQKSLSTRERLDLFMQVCHAVQHAHQKGIIHRDLKPSNILLTVNDGVAVPKVIDFGIAKATGQRLTDRTLFTKFQQLIGTPTYMSPEQTEMTSVDIDTRSDIYSLGVLLYELLTGRTPFDTKELLGAGMEAMMRTIREQDPVRPSARLSTMTAVERTTVAQQRRTEAPKLINLVRGDLDWMVMKCLEKDRARRYETANGLAMDIQRHLDQEPVFARPPTTVYRVQKFLRRNKGLVAATTTTAFVLVLGVMISVWQWRRAELARAGETKIRKEAEANAAAQLKAKEAEARWNSKLCAHAVEQTMDKTLESLASIRVFFEASKTVEPDEFRGFGRSILNHVGGAELLAWIPQTARSQLSELKQTFQRWYGITDFEIRAPDGKPLSLQLSETNSESFPIMYVEAVANQHLFEGIDLSLDPTCAIAMKKARDTDQASATGPVTILTEHFDCVVFLPINSTEDTSRFMGFAMGCFDFSTMVSSVLGNLIAPGVEILLYDKTDSPEGRLVYASNEKATREGPRVEVSFRQAGRVWSVVTIQAR